MLLNLLAPARPISGHGEKFYVYVYACITLLKKQTATYVAIMVINLRPVCVDVDSKL